MAIQSDFMIAINQIAAERNIDAQDIFEAIKHAIKAGFKKDLSEEEGALLNIEINDSTGEIGVFMDKKVTDVVTNPATQISLTEAKKLEPKLRVGDHVEVDITPEGDFGRVAAQTAKQVILQKLREAEKDAQIKRFVDRMGEIETAVVQRMDGDSVIWEINRTTVVMPPEERIPNEYYRSGSKHKVLLKDIRQTPRGKNIIVSRADPKFLEALFRLEIPELSTGAVSVKSIAREAGQRTKVAVMSNVDGIDPIGACVGQKGIRIMAIMNELKMGNTEEKVDIILWDEDETQFVVNSLSPAQAEEAQIVDKKKKIIRVIMPDEQLSLAIGKEGQNVRLAAKLTGWNIDIQGRTVKIESELAKAGETGSEKNVGEETTKKKKSAKKTSKKETTENEFTALGLSAKVVKALDVAGIKNVVELKEKIEGKEKIKGIGPKGLEEIEKAIK